MNQFQKLRPLVQLLPAAAVAAVVLATLRRLPPARQPSRKRRPLKKRVSRACPMPTVYTRVLPAGTVGR